ncbi:MAG: hypothetical protein IIB87_06455 [Chloroflexi bacterium]|nr:hypothetical protein [Chloroflexota bacterium]
MDDRTFEYLLRQLKDVLGVDLQGYKMQQMRRRLTSFIDNRSGGDTMGFIRSLGDDEKMLRSLRDMLTINVTEFFRDADQWNQLRESVMPELIADGKLQVSHELAEKVTYHDSCFLGRHNDIYEPPRDIIKAIPGAELQEIEGHCREQGFCCGAGGAHMWMEESKGQRINQVRCSQAQACAEESGSSIVAANCPFCVQMFDDGFPSVEPDEEKRMKTYDVAELLAQAVFGAENGAAPVEATAAPAAGAAPAEAEAEA